MLLVAAVLVRFLVPTEGGEQGQTLWIATGWLILCGLRCWWLSSQRGWCFPSVTLPDLGVGLLIGGHLLSALLVLGGEGDRRAALNGLWEWVALGATWCMLRERFQSFPFRHLLSRTLWITCTSLALFGLWQHFVWYPQQARDLNDLITLREKVESQQSLSTEERQRYTSLSATLGTEFFSLDEGSRKALYQRAAHSLEPIGRFALANSFAAVLIFGLFLSLEVLLSERRSRARWPSLGTAFTLLSLIAICLLLTKSRTALIGTGLVLCLQGIRWGPLKTKWTRRRLTLAGSGLLLLCLLIAGLIRTGGIDRELLSEAPKSLQYRLEYWQSTAQLLREHPVFGVGPGNFRQHYLQYKLPGASEEILDPHNFLLDAWAGGGLLALTGVLLLTGLVVRRWFSPAIPDQPATHLPPQTVAGVGMLACGLVFAEHWLFEGFTDTTLLGIAGLWVVLGMILSKIIPHGNSLPWVAVSIESALWLHLLGAGGLGMSAILQLVFLAILFSQPISTVEPCSEHSPSERDTVILKTASVIGLALGVLCLWSSLLPVLTTSMLIERSRNLMFSQSSTRSAEQLLREAITADSLSPEPHQQLAMLYQYRWNRDKTQGAEFDQAVKELTLAIQRDPLAGKRRLILASWWLERFHVDPQPEFARHAVDSAQAGLSRYPEYAPLWSALAQAQHGAGDSFADAARKALTLDDLNRKNGHSDKTLPARERLLLEQLLQSENASREPD